MKCDEAGELIFEADLEELEPGIETPLAGHLRECGECRQAARAILGAESAFAAAFDALTPGRSFEESVVTAITAIPGASRRRLRALPVLLPLATAAAILLLLFPLWNREAGIVRDPVIPVLMAEAPALRTPSERSAMIIDSGDPDYQIIWLF